MPFSFYAAITESCNECHKLYNVFLLATLAVLSEIRMKRLRYIVLVISRTELLLLVDIYDNGLTKGQPAVTPAGSV
jgi:hypothetical protein